MSPTRPENNAKSFVFWICSRLSKRHPGKITVFGDVSARWSTVCQEFYIFYFQFFSYAPGYINCARKTLRSNVPLPSLKNSNQNFLKPWKNIARCCAKKSFWIASSYDLVRILVWKSDGGFRIRLPEIQWCISKPPPIPKWFSLAHGWRHLGSLTDLASAIILDPPPNSVVSANHPQFPSDFH